MQSTVACFLGHSVREDVRREKSIIGRSLENTASFTELLLSFVFSCERRCASMARFLHEGLRRASSEFEGVLNTHASSDTEIFDGVIAATSQILHVINHFMRRGSSLKSRASGLMFEGMFDVISCLMSYVMPCSQRATFHTTNCVEYFCFCKACAKPFLGSANILSKRAWFDTPLFDVLFATP